MSFEDLSWFSRSVLDDIVEEDVDSFATVDALGLESTWPLEPDVVLS